jgi:hypothetical protein
MLVKKVTWPESGLSLSDYLAGHQEARSCWSQLSPAGSCLSSAAVSFITDFILTALQRPGILAASDSWTTIGSMPALPLDFLKDRTLVLGGAGEQLGAELLQLLQPAPLKELVIVSDEEGQARRKMDGIIKSVRIPVVLADPASLGTLSFIHSSE